MFKIILQLLLLSLIFTACSTTIIDPVEVNTTSVKVDYIKDVKPILDKRCVTCHSCYNAPCQSKFSSFEGLDRGATKILAYDAMRLQAIEPTRLFEDAKSTKEWREKGFYDILNAKDSNATHNDSIMMHMLYNKKKNPEIIGDYDPENEELKCPKNKEELSEYFEDRPNHGMPYGLPALKDKEYFTLAAWLAQGAKGPTQQENEKLKKPSPKAMKEIEKWETFLNEEDAKHKMTSRYLYEHLYLSHLYFDDSKREFFQIVRSLTPPSQKIETIVTNRVFDDPKVEKFYYRLEKVHSTIVHKTHMVFKLDDDKLSRFNELFIKPEWLEKPHVMSYDIDISSNPFLAFAQIPVRSRYQFLLDNAHYTIMTFIRGPVCRGQMALNVIHDHFWVMFKDPEHEITVLNPQILIAQAKNLSIPIKSTDYSVFEVFSDKFRDKYSKYYEAKESYINNTYPQGQGIESIWKGNKAQDTPLLTVYRHFNSASVHKGVLGEEPRTLWVIDYPQFERIYYSLVAGYDIFGNVTHQTNIRRYMDFLRVEGEANFLSYMPREDRLEMFKSWYIGDDDVQERTFISIEDRGTKTKYKTKYPKSEFIQKVVNEHILKSTNIHFDDINYVAKDSKLPDMPKKFKVKEDFINGLRSLTKDGVGFVKYITNNGVNNAFIRVKLKDGTYIPIYAVVNRWHDNVNSLFAEEDRLDSSKDTIDFLPFSAGSYPNVYVDVYYEDLPDFFDLIKNYDESDKYKQKIQKYFISRSDSKFWEINDWFEEYLRKTQVIEAGLYDLNRYYKTPW